MGRGGETEESSVSLFPFLSILACVIGVMVLMIMAVAMSQMDSDGPDEEAIARAREYVALKKQAEAMRKDIAQLQPELEKDLALRAEAVELQAELERLSKLVAEREKKAADQAKKKKEIEKELADLAEAFAALQAKRDKGLEATDRMQREYVRRIKSKTGRTVKVAPSGGGFSHRMEPIFVEVSGKGLRWYRKGGSVAIPTKEIRSHKGTTALFDLVKANEKRILIFVLREDGIGTWWQAKGFAAEKDVRHGNLPVNGEGELDLSLFGVE